MKKNYIILISILTILILMFGGYYGYKMYKNNKKVPTFEQEFPQNYKEVMDNSIYGTTDSFQDDLLTINDINDSAQTFTVNSDTQIQKIDANKNYVAANKSDLVKGKGVWVYYDTNNQQIAKIIKIYEQIK